MNEKNELYEAMSDRYQERVHERMIRPKAGDLDTLSKLVNKLTKKETSVLLKLF